MNRLTEKSTNYDFYVPTKKVSILDLSDKLGKLEDLMEELNIDNVEELGEYIHDLNIYVGAYANDPPEKTQQIVKDLNTVAKLRKELGCHLEIVFEALISGIIVRNNEELIEIGYSDRKDKYVNFSTEEIYLKNWQSHGIEKTTNCFQITYGDDGEWCVYLKDYKRTWWLPRDKEWKDE